MTIPRQEYAVEFPLGSTGGNVPSVVVRFDLPQVSEEVELARMDAVVRGDGWTVWFRPGGGRGWMAEPTPEAS